LPALAPGGMILHRSFACCNRPLCALLLLCYCVILMPPCCSEDKAWDSSRCWADICPGRWWLSSGPQRSFGYVATASTYDPMHWW